MNAIGEKRVKNDFVAVSQKSKFTTMKKDEYNDLSRSEHQEGDSTASYNYFKICHNFVSRMRVLNELNRMDKLNQANC